MNADYVRQLAQTGDVLAVHGSSLEQRGIQVATVSPFCHVAMMVREPGGMLAVVETLEPHGFQSMSFDDWLASRDGDHVFFCQAPDDVRRGSAAMISRLQIYQDAKAREYDFAALPLVWLSGITGKDYHPDGEVCSLLVADEWEAAGAQVPGNPSPGDFLFLCESASLIK